MAVRQYIGARYVPKFADPVEWDILKAYEALTIVTSNGFTYTSKRAVPAGIALSNTDYWVLTGNYNAQVAQLTEDFNDYVTANDARVDDLENSIQHIDYGYFDGKKINIYGDSISAFTTVATYQPVWVSRLIARVPSTCQVLNFSEPGRYLTGAGGAAGVLSAQSSIDADIIVIFAGVNDWRHGVDIGVANSDDLTTVIGSLQVARNAINQKCPTAKVYLVSPLKTNEPNYPSDHKDAMPLVLYRNVMRAFAGKYGWCYIDGFNAPCLDPEVDLYKTLYQPDGLHCLPAYTNILCDYIVNGIMYGSMPVGKNISRVSLGDFANVSNFNFNFGYMDIDSEGNYSIIIAGTMINVNEGNNTVMTLPPYLLDAFTTNWICFSGSTPLYCTCSNETGVVRVVSPDANNKVIQINGTGKMQCSSFRSVM